MPNGCGCCRGRNYTVCCYSSPKCCKSQCCPSQYCCPTYCMPVQTRCYTVRNNRRCCGNNRGGCCGH